MHPVLIALAATSLHFVLMLATIVVGTGPSFRRRDAGLPLTAYDRGIRGVLRILSFPVSQVTALYPSLLASPGWPREHLLILAGSVVWGIAAGIAAALI